MHMFRENVDCWSNLRILAKIEVLPNMHVKSEVTVIFIWWVGLYNKKWQAECGYNRKHEPHHDKTNKMSVPPAKTQISLGGYLIRVFAVRMKKPWVLSYPLSAQWRLLSDWTDAQADLSLCWAHTHFVDFVMSQLTFSNLAIKLNILLQWNRQGGYLMIIEG